MGCLIGVCYRVSILSIKEKVSAISVSAQGFRTKLNSYAEGRSMLGLAIARLLHTAFVPAPQTCKSVITGLSLGP